MKDIMIKLFGEYNFIKTWAENNKMFFVNADKNIVCFCLFSKELIMEYLIPFFSFPLSTYSSSNLLNSFFINSSLSEI